MDDKGRTAAAWQDITRRMGDDAKRVSFRLMVSAFRFATLAWETSHECEDGSAVLKSGAFAWYYLRNVAEIVRTTGLPRPEVVAKMQMTSDWLERHEWAGIHYFAGQGQCRTLVRETAEKMDADMIAIHDAAARQLRESYGRKESA